MSDKSIFKIKSVISSTLLFQEQQKKKNKNNKKHNPKLFPLGYEHMPQTNWENIHCKSK